MKGWGVWRVFASALLCVVLLMIPPAVSGVEGEKGHTVRVLTYNIQHGADHEGRLDLEGTAAVIRESGADLVALQEVDRHWSDRSGFVEQAQELASRLEMRVRFAPIYSLEPLQEGGPRREYGLAILSRYPITAFKNHDLSRISSLEPEKGIQTLPGFPEAVINLHGQKVHFFNTHLSWLDPGLRLREAEEMLEIMGNGKHPVILAGDMNASPDSPEIGRLSEELTDTFQVAGKGDGFTYPVPDPVRRIDYIFVSGGIQTLSSGVITRRGSDHYGVLSVIRVSKTQNLTEQ